MKTLSARIIREKRWQFLNDDHPPSYSASESHRPQSTAVCSAHSDLLLLSVCIFTRVTSDYGVLCFVFSNEIMASVRTSPRRRPYLSVLIFFPAFSSAS